ncbi:hypothetical protein CRU98_08475 [Arcobacter sp. CECT 8986]|uniref:tyrosine-type recombinase/integrase n=1 Tax=Arcobacter sp. CECT 8986 TaxID=2044507 RepID=UPI001009D4E1|nr:tyrosine-type recombinase/integrase [Arcobacter sp. CECT 8986]RXJ98790.1 hypothetical protein CRU98_08475 [Arcobacter sp. CECT 8986]
MGKYKGISTKKMKDGSIAVMARFKHNGITYPIKNLTKLHGCKTEKEGFEKLNEIKLLLSQDKDPFSTSNGTLNNLFETMIELNEKNGVWAESTIKNQKYFYYKHISSVIGKMKIEKIKYENIMSILNTFKHHQTSAKNQVINVLRPIFKEEYKKGTILKNVMLDIDKIKGTVQKEDLTKRTNHNYTEIVRGLYNAIPLYDQAHKDNIKQHQMFLYMLLLTTHRYGELNQLEKKHCDIKNKKIVAPKTITKSKRDYHYPIPDECLDFIKNAPEGKLFNVPRGGTAGRVFHRLLMKAKIETIDSHSMSMHDTRKLMLSIMVSKLGIDSRLADYCLEHKQQGTIKHYLEFTYEDKVGAYKKYWSYVRNEIIPENEVETLVEIKNKDNNSSNLEKIKELVDLLKNGYITKEQFEIERDKLY